MAKYRIDTIADLARQLTFTPADTRAQQLNAAEDLLFSIDPAKAYPREFVVFRITGFRGKRNTLPAGDLLTGLALQHDLGLLIEQTSETLNQHASQLAEPVLTIDDVTARFNVTSKTIQRWRRKGLPARRFIFADGKWRVGFLLSSVERFLSSQSDQSLASTNVSQIDAGERDEILRRARRLAINGRCTVQETARRVGRRMNRSPLNVLHTIRKYDSENTANAIFARAAAPITDDERGRILRGRRHELSIAELAARFDRPRALIHRVILEERLAKLNRRRVRFIDDQLYHQPDAGLAIEAIADQQYTLPDASERPEDRRVPRDLPPYLQELYRTPLLTPPRERALFIKFNFHKYQFVQARRKLEPEFARARDLAVLEQHLRLATETKNAIVRANLRLVVSIARKHMRPGTSGRLSLMELVSEGNITLMRAVESFDAHKGNRFSTYATLALMKGFARSVPLMLADATGGRALRAGGARVEALYPELADSRADTHDDAKRLVQRDEVRQLVSRLGDRERAVLLAHYGIREPGPQTTSERSIGPVTYDQLSDRFGLSPQRIRQIERAALDKLRAIVGVVSPPSIR